MSSPTFNDRLKHGLGFVRGALSHRYFWLGLAGLIGFWFLVYLFVDLVALPTYTRHGETVTVPDTRTMAFDQARNVLDQYGLVAQQVASRYDPEQPRNRVLQQDPPPNAIVKPGRRILLTVNSAEIPKVVMPDLQFISLREATNRLASLRLTLDEVREDSLPSEYANTITRQLPAAGDSVERGETVTLWVSKGPVNEYVRVPNVTDLRIEEAQRELERARLRFVLFEDTTIEATRVDTVVRQIPPPESEVQVGSEVRIYALQEPDEEEGEQEP